MKTDKLLAKGVLRPGAKGGHASTAIKVAYSRCRAYCSGSSDAREEGGASASSFTI